MGYTPHVVVIGGGVLGTAIARDFVIRGVDVTLVEQGRLSTGTTGRMQGVLYSGARFADENPSGARWCQQESKTLRQIADHCIEETNGIILPAPGEELDELVDSCEKYGLTAGSISRGKVEDELPGLRREFKTAVRTPDATVDPFRLSLANAEGARTYGAEIKTGATVIDLLEADGQVAGVEIEYGSTMAVGREPTSAIQTKQLSGPEGDQADLAENEDDSGDETREEDSAEESEDETAESNDESNGENDEQEEEEMPGEIQRSFPGVSEDEDVEAGEREEIEADFVVNATGAWADRIAALAGIELSLSRIRRKLLVIDGEQTEKIVTARTDSGEPLTITPYQGNTVVGPMDPSLDTDEAIDQLLGDTRQIIPEDENLQILRSYSGVWTQHASSSGPAYGPGVTLIDHKKYDDKWGLLSVVGGTLTTHRLIAEKVVDRVCSEFGIDRECLTDEIQLPGSSNSDAKPSGGSGLLDPSTSASRHDSDGADPILCESRSVTRNAVRAVLQDVEEETDLATVRTRTGATMGACQGGRCGHRIAAELYSVQDGETVEESLDNLLETRWQGRREILRGEQLARAIRDYELHARVFGRDKPPEKDLDLDQFDDGPEPKKEQITRDRSLFGQADTLDFVDPAPESESGRSMCCEAVIR